MKTKDCREIKAFHIGVTRSRFQKTLKAYASLPRITVMQILFLIQYFCKKNHGPGKATTIAAGLFRTITR